MDRTQEVVGKLRRRIARVNGVATKAINYTFLLRTGDGGGALQFRTNKGENGVLASLSAEDVITVQRNNKSKSLDKKLRF